MARAPLVAVVDDEDDLRDPIVDYLRAEGLDAVGASDGSDLDALLAQRAPALVALDVGLPGEDGFSIARRLRATAEAGIIMLTGKRSLVDRVVGLEVGADDYVGKPVDPRELLARIRAVLRRVAHEPSPTPSVPSQTPAAAPANPEAPSTPPLHAADFWVQEKHGMVRVPLETVEWIEADKDYVLLHVQGGRSHTVRVTMAELDRQLDPATMIRVHRSAFVRAEAVQRVIKSGRAATVVLASGAEVQVGPSYLGGVESALRRR